tara:strand:- start:1918 stop:2304 length:387 start_codon:yes stop_codon:yes gene_type:complete
LGGPPTQKKQATSLGGPAHNLQATSSQENYFNFFLELWDLIGYNSWQEDNMKVKEIKKGDKILHSHLGTQPPVSGVVMESPVQGRGVRSTILVDVKGSEVGLFDEIGSIYTSQILKVFRDDNWLPVEQ